VRQPPAIRAFCRVSSRDQGDKGTSLDGQRGRVERWRDERGWTCPIHYYTEIESGGEERREKRAKLDELLRDARPGELVVTILVDRWTRDVVSGVADVRALLARGVGWYGIEEAIDATTDDGKSRLEERAAGAAAERRRIKARTVGARARIKDAGGWAEGPAPFGYRRGDRARKLQHLLVVVPEEASLVREAYHRCVQGQSVEEISTWLNTERGTDKDKRQTWSLLHQRVYLGECPNSRGEWVRGRHEPIVDRDLWQRAQEALKARAKSGGPKAHSPRTNAWVLRGLGSCPLCGVRMGATYSDSKSTRIDYYSCGNRKRYGSCLGENARVDRIDAQAEALALARLVELRVELATPGNDATMGETPKPPPDYAARRAQLAAQLARAETGYIEGVLSKEAVARTRERVDEELGRLAVAEGAAARAARAGDPLLRRRILGEAGRIEQAWARAPVELRRSWIALLARRIVIHGDRPEIEWLTVAELCAATDEAHLFFTIFARVRDPTLSSLTLMGPTRRTSIRTLA
jgi:DNA invertase Pin-like site-specific DNA recombinase